MQKFMIYLHILLLSVILIPFVLSAYNISRKRGIKRKENLLRNTTFLVPEVEDSEIIPKKIFQCYKTIDGVPNKVINNLKKNNPNWEYILYDDKMCIEFLDTHYGKKYSDKFKSIKKGAHKADLWRLCMLYMYGGAYIDVDYELLVPLDSIIENETFITPYTNTFLTRIVNANNIYNAFIITKPKHPVIYDCIQRIMKTSVELMEYDYLVNVRRMKYAVKKFLEVKKLKTKTYHDKKTKILHEYWSKLPYKWSVYDYDINRKIANSKYDNYTYSSDSKSGEFK